MKKKKYFVGGMVNQGVQAAGNAAGMPGQSSQMLGGTAQAAMGALTGNPMDITGGLGNILSAGINNAKSTFQNENASFGDKALAAYGIINPAAGIISSFKNKDYERQQETKNTMNNIIKNNMMANGGLLPKEAYAVNNVPTSGITRPVTNYQPMQGIPIQGIPQQQPSNNLAPVPKLSSDEIRRLNLVRSYNLGQAYDAELQDYYMDANPQMEHDIGRSIVNRPAANPGQVERGIQSDLDVIRQAEGRKRKPARLFAGGGKLNRFDGGFTHNDPSAQNSFEGIPIARGDNGEMHVVENGEASLPTSDGNQFIFPEQLKLTKELSKQFNIANKHIGKSFSNIIKSYENNMRKDDPLDKKTFDINSQNLMAASEQAKQISEIGKVYKMAKGGKLNINKYDGGSWLDSINTYRQVQTSPELGIPYRYNDQMDNPKNNIKQDFINQALPYNNNFFDPSAPSLGFNQDYYTRRGYEGTDQQSQNDWIKSQLNQENINNWLSSDSPVNRDVEWRQNLIAEIQLKQPELYNALMNGEVPEDKLIELYTEGEVGPIQSLVVNPMTKLQSSNTILPGTELKDPGLSPVPSPTISSSDDKEKDPKKTPNLPNLWPELGLAGNLGAMAMLNPQYMTPSTMSTGYLRNRDLDVDNEKVASQLTNAISGITGSGVGGGGARSNILAAQINAGRTLSDWQRNIDATNVQNNLNTDTYNLNMQTSNDRFNTGNINQVNTMNTNIANQTNRELADTFASAVGNYSVAGNDRYYSNRGADFWGKATGYDPKTAQYLLAMQNTNKPVEDTKASAYGGIIKTRKRKLK